MPTLRTVQSLLLATLLSMAGFARATPPVDPVVPGPQAVARIEALIAELQAQRKEANGRFYDGAAYLRTLFEQAAVPPRAMQYAKAWGDNIVYLNWNSAEAFYGAHLDALGGSLNLVRNGRRVASGDLDYLAGGVRLWRQEEDLLDTDLTRSATLYAQQARKLGERMAIEGGVEADPQRAQLAAEAEDLRRQAVAAAQAAITRSRQRLFSALDAGTRIALDAPAPEPDCETVERSDIVDTDAAFDGLERALRAELEAGGGD